MFIEKYNLFSTPVYYYNFTKLDGKALIKLLYKWKNNSQGVQKSNELGWQSSAINGDEWSEFSNLSNYIKKCIYDIHKIGIHHIEYWGNISPPLAFNAIHEHGNSPFHYSGVFYLQTDKLTGNINFTDRYNTSSHHSFSPNPGDLLLFPPYSPHWVKPNKSKKDRVSIAFNVILEKPYRKT